MNRDLEVSYIGIEVDDPASYTDFFSHVVGLVPGPPTSSAALSWTNDAAAHRVILEQGPANDAAYVGFEAADDEAFDTISSRLAAAGFELTPGTEQEVTAKRVEQLGHVAAPWGTRIELVTGLERTDRPFHAPLVEGGFFTERVGFGHVVFAALPFEEAHRFLIDGLGMGQSDWIETEIMEGVDLEVRFYHCNPRHHTVALARAPFEMPQLLHHIMFETNERDDVGLAFDRAWNSGLPIANGLGRHDNDEMFSFYVVSPGGFQVEIGYGARTITDDWSENRRYDRISSWGHQPVQRP
jgi:2,3-dihydroxybiphenyl 1,2-dioxygenase